MRGRSKHSIAPATKSDNATSPNKRMKGHVHCTEQPVGCKTQWNYDIHVWWSQHMKRHLQYIARGNRTHPPTSPNIAPATESDIPKYERNGWNVIYYARPIRAWSDHEPVSPQPARSRRFPVELSGGSLYWKTNHLYQLTNKNLVTSHQI